MNAVLAKTSFDLVRRRVVMKGGAIVPPDGQPGL